MSKLREPIVDLKDVCVSFGEIHVLEDITLTVRQGEIVGLVGPNGAGKTTLIRSILGLEPNCCGSVRVFNEKISSKVRRRIGYVPQKMDFVKENYPGTVEEIVFMGRLNAVPPLKSFKEDDQRIVSEALERTSIIDLRERRVSELSGGQQQRVLIAKALASEPQFLILDEPTSGVDVASQIKLYAILHSLNSDKDLTILISSHDLHAIQSLASRVVILNKKIAFAGTPEEFESKEEFWKDFGFQAFEYRKQPR